MQILLTNDDGIFAPGLSAIYDQLVKIGDVIVVAPASGQSGASHSITFTEPLICNKVDINGQFIGYSVQGSPADCVKLAVMELALKPIDLVVSGINFGANAGINVFYSGTVAAAIEAAFLKIPAVAMSLSWEDDMDFATAAALCANVLDKLMPITPGDVININIPHLSRGIPKGVKVVPQASKGFLESYTKTKNKQGQTVFQLTGHGHLQHHSPADINALEQGFIAVTALSDDMTNHKKNQQLEKIDF